MRLLPRDSDFGSVASVLSLATANYKPIPQLPTSNTTLPFAALTSGDGRSEASLGRGYSFKVEPSNIAGSYAATHPLADWGEPSTLFIPVTANGTSPGHKFASGRRVGNGNCPYSEEYTPRGGWSNLPPPTFAPFDPVKATIMRYRQQQGTNLGSWFVQEGWMESDFMSCATGSKQAEFDIMDGFGSSADGLKSARAYMEQHWDTFITEDDFKKLADMGINTVRLPIGYWSVGPYFCHSSPFEAYRSVYQFSWRYVARAINWAAKYDIGVLLDLHGAYGSQNGQAHSGLADGNIQWYNSYNQDLTTELLVWLAKEISDVTNVIGIQLLNEPQNRDPYWTWLPGAMDAMRKASPNAEALPLYFHDAFVLDKGAKFVNKRSDFVVSDHHSYYVYTDSDKSTSAQGHISQLDGEITNDFESASATARRNLIVGEWSCALATSSLKGVKNKEAVQKEFCEAQRSVWESTTAGWQFWSYRLENCKSNPGWCFEGSVGKYLASTFNVWNLPTAPILSLSKAADARAELLKSPLVQAINAIKVPASAARSFKATPRVGKVMLVDIETDDDDEEADEAAARLAMSRIVSRSFVVGAPQAAHPATVQGSGGAVSRAKLWARNHRIFARAASQSAGARGYKDGFYTTKIFAAQGYLSRLGFAEQYRQDTWQTYLDANVYQGSEADEYKQQFLAGAQAGEQAVSYEIVQKGKQGATKSANGTDTQQVSAIAATAGSTDATLLTANASSSAPALVASATASSAAAATGTTTSSASSSAAALSRSASATSAKPTAAEAAAASTSSSPKPSLAAAAATSSSSAKPPASSSSQTSAAVSAASTSSKAPAISSSGTSSSSAAAATSADTSSTWAKPTASAASAAALSSSSAKPPASNAAASSSSAEPTAFNSSSSGSSQPSAAAASSNALATLEKPTAAAASAASSSTKAAASNPSSSSQPPATATAASAASNAAESSSSSSSTPQPSPTEAATSTSPKAQTSSAAASSQPSPSAASASATSSKSEPESSSNKTPSPTAASASSSSSGSQPSAATANTSGASASSSEAMTTKGAEQNGNPSAVAAAAAAAAGTSRA